jgi:hypothetical protein
VGWHNFYIINAKLEPFLLKSFLLKSMQCIQVNRSAARDRAEQQQTAAMYLNDM